MKESPDRFFDPPPRTEPCRFILDYWQGLRGDLPLPRRADVDPAAMARHLAHVGLFEVHSADLTLCRVAGTAFRLSLGFELTGKNVVQLYTSEWYRAAGYRFSSIVSWPCAATVEMSLRFSSGAEHPHEVLLLPLEPAPGARPTILVGTAGIGAVTWQNAATLPQLHSSSYFRFIDIGAGIPDSTHPPEDFGA